MPRGRFLATLAAGAVLLAAAAWLRGAEYDEQYSLFLTGSVARPAWPTNVITAGNALELQAPHATFGSIAHDLRRTDVHPPLYFWMLEIWRRLLGNSLFVARLASVLCSIATLGAVAAIARSAAIPPVPAVLLTLGCYGFAYTGSIARGFALAQMLSVTGIAVMLAARERANRMFAAGALLGAATFTNYLAVFVASAALTHSLIAAGRSSRWRCVPAFAAFIAFLPADLWFFLAQRQSRAGQFMLFEPAAAAARLARYSAAAVFGGLPLYVGGIARTAVTAALALLLSSLMALIVVRRRHIGIPAARLLIIMAALAPPVGLLLLALQL